MNEVEETLRILERQAEEYGLQVDMFGQAYDEFSLKCEHSLDKETFDFISDILYKAVKFYENKLDDTKEARNEILEKYNIPYTVECDKP